MSVSFGPGFHAAPGRAIDPLAYERYIGRWSRLFVPAVLAAAEVTGGDRVLDVATGTGEAAAKTFLGACRGRTTGAREWRAGSRVGSRGPAARRLRLHDRGRQDRRDRHTSRPGAHTSARHRAPQRLILGAPHAAWRGLARAVSRGLALARPVVLDQYGLAKADVLRRDLQALVVTDELQRLFEGEVARGHQAFCLLGRG